VNGSITLCGGVVDIDFANGFQPKAGESFALMTATNGMSFANDLIPYTDARRVLSSSRSSTPRPIPFTSW
jgi:hypothetical protein